MRGEPATGGRPKRSAALQRVERQSKCRQALDLRPGGANLKGGNVEGVRSESGDDKPLRGEDATPQVEQAPELSAKRDSDNKGEAARGSGADEGAAMRGNDYVTKGSDTDEVEETGRGNDNFTRGSDTDEVEDAQRGSEAEDGDERGSTTTQRRSCAKYQLRMRNGLRAKVCSKAQMW